MNNITQLLQDRLEQRKLIGLYKYGQELTPHTNINLLDEAIDEALDLAVYLMALKQKWEGPTSITYIPPTDA